MGSYQWLLHPDSAEALAAYRRTLAEQGVSIAGAHLREALGDQQPGELGDERFLEILVNTKRPQFFAESALYGDGRDWNPTELALLGDLGFAAPVTIFDDGRHHSPSRHPAPLAGTLLFVPGALLRNGRGCRPADWHAVTRDSDLDPDRYFALYERRLLPLLRYADADAAAHGRTALITMPGLGCGQFAGPFAGRLGERLKEVLIALFARHAPRLPHLRLVYYDPYAESRNERHDFGQLSLRVRPLLQGNADRPQLCAPAHYGEAGDGLDDSLDPDLTRGLTCDLSDCRLYSVVAWDHVSWPGSDFWDGARVTDDGVKAAATDLMRVITGVEGHYFTGVHAYQPPEPYATWEALVQDRGTLLQVIGRWQVLG